MAEPERIDGMTLLMQACLEGNTRAVQTILQKQPSSVQEKDAFGKTPLHYTVENVHADCTSALLTANPRLINVQDGNGYAALHFAAMAGNTVVLERLMQAQEVNVNIEDNEKHTPVHWATVCGHPSCIELLVGHGATAETADIHGAFPLHYAAQMCGTEYEIPGIGMHCLSKLVRSGANVNCVDGSGRTPLLWAASAGSAEACTTLVQAGADPKSSDKDGLTALHCAASRGHHQCCDVLVSQCGCPVDSLDRNQCTPLFYAISFGHGSCTSLLLQQGALPDHQDSKGRSPAYCAAAKGQTSMVPILQEHGGSLDIPTQDGDTALLEAVKGGHTDMVRQLLVADCDVNAVTKSGRTALHEAAEKNNLEMCRLIIDAGGKRNLLVQDGQGNSMTARELAEQNGHKELGNYLRSRGMADSAKVKNQAARTVTSAVRRAGNRKKENAAATVIQRNARGMQGRKKVETIRVRKEEERKEEEERRERERRERDEKKQREELQRRELEKEEALRQQAKEMVEDVILAALMEEEERLKALEREHERQSKTDDNSAIETEEGKNTSEEKNRDLSDEKHVHFGDDETEKTLKTGSTDEQAKEEADDCHSSSSTEEQSDAEEEKMETSAVVLPTMVDGNTSLTRLSQFLVGCSLVFAPSALQDTVSEQYSSTPSQVAVDKKSKHGSQKSLFTPSSPEAVSKKSKGGRRKSLFSFGGESRSPSSSRSPSPKHRGSPNPDIDENETETPAVVLPSTVDGKSSLTRLSQFLVGCSLVFAPSALQDTVSEQYSSTPSQVAVSKKCNQEEVEDKVEERKSEKDEESQESNPKIQTTKAQGVTQNVQTWDFLSDFDNGSENEYDKQKAVADEMDKEEGEKDETSEKKLITHIQSTKFPEVMPNVQTWDTPEFDNILQGKENIQEEWTDEMDKEESENEQTSQKDEESSEGGVDEEMYTDQHRDNETKSQEGEDDHLKEKHDENKYSQTEGSLKSAEGTPEAEPSLQILQAILQDEDSEQGHSEQGHRNSSREKKKVHIVAPTTLARVDKTISAQRETKWVRNVKIQANMDVKTTRRSAGIQCSFVRRPVSPTLVKGIQTNPLFQDNVDVKAMVDGFVQQNRRRRLRPSSAPFPIALNRSVLETVPRKSRLQEWKTDLDKKIPETVREAGRQENRGMAFSALLQEEERILREVSNSTGPEQIEHLKRRLSYIHRLLQFNAEVTRMAKEEEQKLSRELFDHQMQQRQMKERDRRRQQVVEEEMKAMTNFFENLKTQISPGGMERNPDGQTSQPTSPRSADGSVKSPPSHTTTSPRMRNGHPHYRQPSSTHHNEHSHRPVEHSTQTGQADGDYDDFYDGIMVPPQPSRASFTHKGHSASYRARSSYHKKHTSRRHHPSPRQREQSPHYRDHPSPRQHEQSPHYRDSSLHHHRQKSQNHREPSPQHRSRDRSASSSPKPERRRSPAPSPGDTPSHDNYSYSSDTFDEDSSEEEDSSSDTETEPPTPPGGQSSSKDSPRRRGPQAWNPSEEVPHPPRRPHPPPRKNPQRESLYRQKGYIYYPPVPRVESLDTHTAALYSHLHNSQHSFCLKLDKPLRPSGKASSTRKNLKPSYIKLDYCNRAVEKHREGNSASSGYLSEEPPRNGKPAPIKRPKTASNLIYTPRKRTIYPEEEELWNLSPSNRRTVISR